MRITTITTATTQTAGGIGIDSIAPHFEDRIIFC